LKIDEAVYKNATILCTKYQSALNTCMGSMLNAALGLKADPTAAKANPNPEEADEVLKMKKFHVCLRDLDLTCNKIPMFTDYLNKYELSKQRAFLNGNVVLTEIGMAYGYAPSMKQKFGFSCAQKTFCQDLHNPLSTHIDHQLHINQHAGHSSNIALKYYEDHNEYQRLVPLNVCQSTVNIEVVTEMLKNIRICAALDDQLF